MSCDSHVTLCRSSGRGRGQSPPSREDPFPLFEKQPTPECLRERERDIQMGRAVEETVAVHTTFVVQCLVYSGAWSLCCRGRGESRRKTNVDEGQQRWASFHSIWGCREVESEA